MITIFVFLVLNLFFVLHLFPLQVVANKKISDVPNGKLDDVRHNIKYCCSM